MVRSPISSKQTPMGYSNWVDPRSKVELFCENTTTRIALVLSSTYLWLTAQSYRVMYGGSGITL